MAFLCQSDQKLEATVYSISTVAAAEHFWERVPVGGNKPDNGTAGWAADVDEGLVTASCLLSDSQLSLVVVHG